MSSNISEDLRTQQSPDKHTLSLQDITSYIPHRYPMLLIDRIDDVILGESATGIKHVTCNEPFFPGHFPTQFVMPGVLITEAMAQTSAVLVMHTLNLSAKDHTVYFMTLNNVRFRQPVLPGCCLRLCVQKKARRNAPIVWKFVAKAYVDTHVVAEAEYSAMIRRIDDGIVPVQQ